jgi:hypothetical protein
MKLVGILTLILFILLRYFINSVENEQKKIISLKSTSFFLREFDAIKEVTPKQLFLIRQNYNHLSVFSEVYFNYVFVGMVIVN